MTPTSSRTSKALADYYEECVRLFPEPKQVSNWIMGDLLRLLKEDDKEVEECPLAPRQLAEMLRLIKDGTISGKIAKTVFEEMYRTGKAAKEIVEEKGLVQITDADDVTRTVEEVLKNHPKEVAEVQKRQGEALRLLRRPGDEGDPGQGQPAAGERYLKKTPLLIPLHSERQACPPP